MHARYFVKYSDDEKLTIIADYLRSDLSQMQIGEKYHIGHDTVRKWMAKFAIDDSAKEFLINYMPSKNKPEEVTVETLKEKVCELQKALDREKLKNLALTTMIDVAEEELHVNIRKKAGAKQ